MVKRNPVMPYVVGCMVDIPGFPGLTDMFPAGFEFALEEAYEEGVVDRPVKVIRNEHLGQPWDDGLRSREAYLELVDKHKVLAIAGPMTTDNSMAVLDLVEEKRVPSITICGSQDYVGRYAFNTSNGNLCDEPAYMAAWLQANGYKKVGIIQDYPSKIGQEYARFFDYAAQMFGIDVLMTARISPYNTEKETTEAMKKLKDANPDALVYLGFGDACRWLNKAMKKIKWLPPRIMTTAFVQATYSEFFAKLIDGWHGIDQYDERNKRFAKMLQRYKKKKKGKELVPNTATSTGYDIGRCIALAMSRMQVATPESLADALETIRMLPAMTGGSGTYITFGPHDRRGFKGLDYLNVRVAKNGKTELVDFDFGEYF